MEQSQDQRRFSRVDFHIVATVAVGGQPIEGTVENMSLRGMLFATDHKLSPGDEAEITIALNDHSENGMTISGKVARLTSYGIAFVFSKVDFDSYMHLKNIIALNIGDASKVDEEMDAFLDSQSDSL